MMRTEATGLLEEWGRVVGVEAATRAGPVAIRSDLVVAADGRHSALRAQAGLKVRELGAPMDVLWFHLSASRQGSTQSMGRFDAGQIFIMIYRGDYWQCGYVIPKGAFERIRAAGLPAFRDRVARLAPILSEQVRELRTWDDVKLLTVRVDRLTRWYRPGFLCIGDAAHAMSPIGGVGINRAIQDAAAAANCLVGRQRADSANTRQRRGWAVRGRCRTGAAHR